MEGVRDCFQLNSFACNWIRRIVSKASGTSLDHKVEGVIRLDKHTPNTRELIIARKHKCRRGDKSEKTENQARGDDSGRWGPTISSIWS